MRRSLLLSLLLFLCAVPFVRAAMPGPGMPVPAPVVEVGEVLAVQDTQSRRYTGRVVSPATVSLVPRVAGEILEVGFRDGDTVQAGQMLYRIDPVRYEAAVKNARGKVVQYKAEHAYPGPTWPAIAACSKSRPSAVMCWKAPNGRSRWPMVNCWRRRPTL